MSEAEDIQGQTGRVHASPRFSKPTVELVKVPQEMKSFKAYDKLRVERMNDQHVGARLKRAAEAEKEEKK
ncbi:hypothetical protein Ddye_022658 [Dipteronia dyeriana]|uniref:Uncharacterized protein n=1 Tax=Dipteronia dyeriana TaxID=168575 RepID=A0AAD9TRH2_9ROSI|nr:hypothetical protein Ddye_022658 [Dipteronia dyeriana]